MSTSKPSKPPQYITMAQAARAYGVTVNCIFGWRNGTPTKSPMPVEHIEGTRNVRLKLSALRAWNKQHGLAFQTDPADIVATDVAEQAKQLEAKRLKSRERATAAGIGNRMYERTASKAAKKQPQAATV